ncbi:MAG TPA: hypothetical protein VK638_21315 [Edaphobacter sp.]|nr:hypothetical protein [Edaphobacter sp.]
MSTKASMVSRDRDLRGELFCAQVHRCVLAGRGVFVAVLPPPFIVSPRYLAQTASLKALPCVLAVRAGSKNVLSLLRIYRLSYLGSSSQKLTAHWISMQLHMKYLQSLEQSDRINAA